MVWSDWRRLEQPAKYNGPAVYRIRLCNSGVPVSIKRFLDSDDRGLLCIGQTKNLEDRRKKFIRGRANGKGHSEANLLHILEKVTSLAANYPINELRVPPNNKLEALTRDRKRTI